jgi:hypothetical protein
MAKGSQRRPVGRGAAYRPQRSFSFSAATVADLGERGDAIKGVGPSLLDELGRIIYLGPIRRLAQRDYIWAGRMPAHIGDDGSKAVDALIASGVALQQAKRRKQSPPPEGHLFTKPIEWLKRMNLANGLLVRALGTSARYELLVQNEDEYSNLKDVGVGVLQLLPVIVAALGCCPTWFVSRKRSTAPIWASLSAPMDVCGPKTEANTSPDPTEASSLASVAGSACGSGSGASR